MSYQDQPGDPCWLWRAPPWAVVSFLWPNGVTGLDCDGADSGNWAVLDVAAVRWLRFQGRPVSNALRSLVSR